MLGLLRPATGDIRVLGQHADDRPRCRIGYMPQHLAARPAVPGERPRRRAHGPPRPARSSAPSAQGRSAARAGPRRGRAWPTSPPAVPALSGGQRQRVLIARALAVRTRAPPPRRAHREPRPPAETDFYELLRRPQPAPDHHHGLARPRLRLALLQDA